MDACRSFRVRVREQADNGSLFGPVLSWNVAAVAALVTDAPAPAEVEPAPPVADEPKPLTVAMVISIDGTHYAVAPLAPSPAAVKAFRFIRADETARYDLDESSTGASCSCPDFIWRREGLDPSGCKHVKAARMMGLFAEAPEPTPDPDREPRLVDDDGTTLEAPREMDARHRAQHAAAVAALMDGNPFLPAAREVEPEPCCPPTESMPCQGCLSHDGSADLSDDGWDDSHVWASSDDADGPAARSLAEQVDDHARQLRSEGSPLGDLLAERAESLAGQIRALDATTVDQFRDRRRAMLTDDMDRAGARHASCC